MPGRSDHNVTDREREILSRLASGDTYEDAAIKMGITIGQVKNSLAVVKAKLGARNTTHAVAIAVRRKIIL